MTINKTIGTVTKQQENDICYSHLSIFAVSWGMSCIDMPHKWIFKKKKKKDGRRYHFAEVGGTIKIE